MSYSFAAKGKDKAAALADAEEKMKAVIASQPVHARDANLAREVREKTLAIMVDNPAMDVSLSCSGSVSYTGDGSAEGSIIVGASVSVWANYAEREKQSA